MARADENAQEPVDFATFTKPRRRKLSPARLLAAQANAKKAREVLARNRAKGRTDIRATAPPPPPPLDPSGVVGLAAMITELIDDPDFRMAMHLFGDVIRRYAEKHGRPA